MRIATWNVNSAKQRLPRLLAWLDERSLDVVCLKETRLADEALVELLGGELAERGYELAAHGSLRSRDGGAVEREPLWNLAFHFGFCSLIHSLMFRGR